MFEITISKYIFRLVAPASTLNVWRYFDRVGKNESNCNIYSHFIKSLGNTSNYIKHLKGPRIIIDATLTRPKERRISDEAIRILNNKVEEMIETFSLIPSDIGIDTKNIDFLEYDGIGESML